MAKARSQNVPGISLFPFLSILVCLIGVLVLLIVVLSMLQGMLGDGRSIEEFARARAAQELQREMSEREEEMESWKVEIAAAEQTAGQLERERERYAVLRRQFESIEEEKETIDQRIADVQRQLENLLVQQEQMQKEKPEIEKVIAELQKELQRRKINLEAEPTLVVQPAGAGIFGDERNLFFVECTADGIVIHGRDDEEEPVRVTSGSIGADEAYNQFLQEATRADDSTIVFLLRPDGLATYNRAAGWAESRFEARHGRIPLPGQGAVDLSHFDR